MKFPLARDVFPSLELSTQDEDVLRSVAVALVTDTLQQFRAQRQLQRAASAANNTTAHASLYAQLPLRIEQDDVVDTARWRLLKRRDNVRVYKERASFHAARLERQWQHHRPPPAAQDPFRSTIDVTSTDDAQQHILPMMMGLGTIQGSVDDIVYGLLSHTHETAQLRAAYVESDIVDTHVLATVTRPSAAAPLKSLAVKWCAKRHNGFIRSLVRYRDFVAIEATGTVTDAHGERMGYHVVHSIAVPGVRELHELNVVRAKISMCCVFRQAHTNTVELFMRGFLNPLGDVRVSAAMASAAESVLSLWQSVRCAQMKKLMWALTHAPPRPLPMQRAPIAAINVCCAICRRSARASLHALKQCQVCRRFVCARCRVLKKLHFLSPPTMAALAASPAAPSAGPPTVDVVHKTALFCPSCIFAATQTSATELAVREHAQMHEYVDAHAVLSTLTPASSRTIALSTRSRAFTSPMSSRSCASSSAASSVYASSASTYTTEQMQSARAQLPLSARGSHLAGWFS